jgi:hypothetical protein
MRPHQMVERADAAGGDHRHRHRVGDGAGERDVEARLGAVAVHGGQQDLAGAEFAHARAQATASMPVGLAPAVGEDLPACLRADRLGVDRDDDALAAELLRRLAHEVRVGDGGGVDRHLVGAGQQQLRMSSTVRTPPPTVSGMKHCSAVRAPRRAGCRGSRGSR